MKSKNSKKPSTVPSTVCFYQKINPCKSVTYKGLKFAFAVWTGSDLLKNIFHYYFLIIHNNLIISDL